MKKRKLLYAGAVIVILAAGGGLYAYSSSSPKETTLATLSGETHFHGIAADPNDPRRFYLATHHGLFTVGPDGKAKLIAEKRDDFMGFTAHPTDSSVLYASGHPAGGGNLGFMVSTDGGRSWTQLSKGVNGPVDFHQMDVSKANPRVIYGVYGDLQRSADAGRSWVRVGPAPTGIIGLAASSIDANTLYAATENGLMRSVDGGQNWRAVEVPGRIVTMVHASSDGTIYAFIVGRGLIKATEKDLQWQTASNAFGDDYVLHFATSTADRQQFYAITLNPRNRTQSVVASRDGGSHWTKLGVD
jgi:photosystem II stability/assembly factor-like uncharacterized protein